MRTDASVAPLFALVGAPSLLVRYLAGIALYEGGEQVGGLLVLVGQHVAVGVPGDLNAGVPESLAHDLDLRATLDTGDANDAQASCTCACCAGSWLAAAFAASTAAVEDPLDYNAQDAAMDYDAR